jgi:hypothetical protein
VSRTKPVVSERADRAARRRRPLCWIAALAMSTGVALAGQATAQAAVARRTEKVRIETPSTRADLVSGDQTLVRVVVAKPKLLRQMKVFVGSRDVTSSFAMRANGHYEGLLTELALGQDVVRAVLPNGTGAQLTITNHPNGGPVFAGPQVQPWICNTEKPPHNAVAGTGAGETGLGSPADAQCDTPVADKFVYKSAASGQFEAYNPASPPPAAAIASTTTDQGVTLPYIVREEFGAQDRGVYAIAVLYEPGKPWYAWAPQHGWNHKLVVTFGASTAPWHDQSEPSKVLNDDALSRGFMSANSGLNVHGQNANDAVSAEALEMLKEHISNEYGPIRHTIGEGCSGGGLQQYIIAATYPGLLDGLQPNCSFPDVWTTAPDVAECHLLDQYFTKNPSQTWVPGLDGHKDPSDCATWDATFWGTAEPQKASNCELPESDVYNAEKNPNGTRCTVNDYQQAIWGPRPESEWGPVEKRVGRGFANRPITNVGVQYGLKTLEEGKITAAEFADMNAKIGGADIDGNPTAARAATNAATAETAYRAGQVTDTRQLTNVPIIDLRGYSESGEIHTSYYSYETRARMDEQTGTHANQLIWTFPGSAPIVGLGPPHEIALKSFLLLDRWLTNIESDTSARTPAEKVIADKPSNAHDACFVEPGTVPGGQSGSGAPTEEITNPEQCNAVYPHYGDTRTAAGAPQSGDVIDCQLKPLDRADYKVTFTEEQWTQMKQAFPTGVCDWSKPGVGEQPSIPWTTFAGGPGGKPLGQPPASKPLA